MSSPTGKPPRNWPNTSPSPSRSPKPSSDSANNTWTDATTATHLAAQAARTERTVQHAADHLSYARALDPDWVKTADLTGLGQAWGAAAGWADTDPTADLAAHRIEERLAQKAPAAMARYTHLREHGTSRIEAMHDVLAQLATEAGTQRRVFVAHAAPHRRAGNLRRRHPGRGSVYPPRPQIECGDWTRAESQGGTDRAGDRPAGPLPARPPQTQRRRRTRLGAHRRPRRARPAVPDRGLRADPRPHRQPITPPRKRRRRTCRRRRARPSPGRGHHPDCDCRAATGRPGRGPGHHPHPHPMTGALP